MRRLLTDIGCVFKVLLVDALIVVAAGGFFLWHVTRPSSPAFADPYPGSTFKIIALGDSYISGEGAREFYQGTDVPGQNTCHRASDAYPVLLAERLHAGLTFAACSGARTANVTVVPQERQRNQAIPGGVPQISYVQKEPDANVILVSIGGNDAGFGEIGKSCMLGGNCLVNADAWLRRLNGEVYTNLVRTFRAIRRTASASTQIFALTYPDPLSRRPCLAPLLSGPEQGFLRNDFIPRLDGLVQLAAQVARIRSIDLQHALDGRRICEVSMGRASVNVDAFGRSFGTGLLHIKGIAHDSLHPNALGHRMIARRILPVLERARNGTLPPLAEAPADIKPPPIRESVAGPPGPQPFPRGTPCHGTAIDKLLPVAVPPGQSRTQLPLNAVSPHSTVCYRGFEQSWRSVRAPRSGRLVLSLDTSFPGIASTSQVLYRSTAGNWLEAVVARTDIATRIQRGIDRLLIYGGGGVLAFFLALNTLGVALCTRHHRRKISRGPDPAGRSDQDAMSPRSS